MAPAEAGAQVIDAETRILLDAADENGDEEGLGYVVVEPVDMRHVKRLVHAGLLQAAEWYRAGGWGDVLIERRFELTTAGWAFARALADVEAQARQLETAGDAWRRWPGAIPCAGCKCTPAMPCPVRLDGDKGTGRCVPAGIWGQPRCSRCTAAEAM